MQNMREQNIARLEAQLERLIEGAFANLFSRRVSAQDIALAVARAMEDGIRAATGSDPRPLAPDHYVLYLNSKVQAQLLQRYPLLPQILSEHIVELATNSGYRLVNQPLIRIHPDSQFDAHHIRVHAQHTNRAENSTAVMQRVELPAEQTGPRNPQLVISGKRNVELGAPIINIGRQRDNHIVLDDPAISRHHVQLRIHRGGYLLFDVQSHTGTYVNDVRVKEHRLQSGDVIRMGTTRLVYIEDESYTFGSPGTTSKMDTVQQDPEL